MLNVNLYETFNCECNIFCNPFFSIKNIFMDDIIGNNCMTLGIITRFSDSHCSVWGWRTEH